jgi:hypothetical protein
MPRARLYLESLIRYTIGLDWAVALERHRRGVPQLIARLRARVAGCRVSLARRRSRGGLLVVVLAVGAVAAGCGGGASHVGVVARVPGSLTPSVQRSIPAEQGGLAARASRRGRANVRVVHRLSVRQLAIDAGKAGREVGRARARTHRLAVFALAIDPTSCMARGGLYAAEFPHGRKPVRVSPGREHRLVERCIAASEAAARAMQRQSGRAHS